MICERCQDEVKEKTGKSPDSLANCICPDIDERIREMAKSPYLSITFCSGCNREWTRCSCPKGKPN